MRGFGPLGELEWISMLGDDSFRIARHRDGYSEAFGDSKDQYRLVSFGTLIRFATITLAAPINAPERLRWIIEITGMPTQFLRWCHPKRAQRVTERLLIEWDAVQRLGGAL